MPGLPPVEIPAMECALGLEPTPEAFIGHLVLIFRAVRDVLREDGTCWVNLGDSYAGSWGAQSRGASDKGTSTLDGNRPRGRAISERQIEAHPRGQARTGSIPQGTGLKGKDLIGIPWRFAFAMQADGWWIRQDNVWAKDNPMPESVRDRTTRAHEYVFHFAKSATYFYDADAVREADGGKASGNGFKREHRLSYDGRGNDEQWTPGGGRNKRSVWRVSTKAYAGDHYATFPPGLPEPCVLAGTSERGCCPECGAPWARVVDRSGMPDTSRPQAARTVALFREAGLTDAHLAAIRAVGVQDAGKALSTKTGAGANAEETQRLADEAKGFLGGYFREFAFAANRTAGWEPTCDCLRSAVAGYYPGEDAALSGSDWTRIADTAASSARHLAPVPCVVLDPFAGRSTTGVVSLRHGRRFIGIELNPKDAEASRARLARIDAHQPSFDLDAFAPTGAACMTRPPLRVLSLGAGVQSSTLLLMAAAGELEHMPDAAIFADTEKEPRAVYEWLDWLEEQVRGVIPIYRVSAGNIAERIYTARSTGKRYATLPLFVRNTDGSTGMAHRQCTKEFKIEPIIRRLRELVAERLMKAEPGLVPQRIWDRIDAGACVAAAIRGWPLPRGRVFAEQWMGISLDEAVRMKDSRTPWVRNRYPLIDLRMTRRDCLRWWEARGLPSPPKSACIICPYTEDHRWREMKENAPGEFAEAVEFDRYMRDGAPAGVKLRGQNFLHRSCVPLDEVDFSTAEERGQGNLFDGFANECEGMCGV
jgi:hypothetical protein